MGILNWVLKVWSGWCFLAQGRRKGQSWGRWLVTLAEEPIGTVLIFLGAFMITDVRTGRQRFLSTDSSQLWCTPVPATATWMAPLHFRPSLSLRMLQPPYVPNFPGSQQIRTGSRHKAWYMHIHGNVRKQMTGCAAKRENHWLAGYVQDEKGVDIKKPERRW